MIERDRGPSELPGVRLRDGGRVGAAVGWAALLALAALLGCTVAGRATFAPPSALTIAVTFLPFLYVTYAVGTFGLWSLLPDRMALPLGSGVALVVAAGLWGPSWGARGVEDDDSITVMSWNIRRLWGGPDDGGDAAACVIDAVKEVQPDVVSFLEVSADNTEALSEALGMRCVHTNYRQSDSRQRGGLASCVSRDAGVALEGTPQRFVDHEDWWYVFAEVRLGTRVFNLLTVHLYPTTFSTSRLQDGIADFARGRPGPLRDLSREGEQVVRGQSDQVAALLHRVERFQDPTVVAGDFNSTRDAALHRALRETLTDTWERGGLGFGATVRFLGWIPLRIDYVYASDEFDVVGADVLPVGCSDHRPVVSRVVLRPR